MKMTIGKKFSSIIIVLLVLMPVLMAVNWLYAKRSKWLAEHSRTRSAVFAIKSKDMQMALMQVHQRFTNILVTGGVEGFEDGLRQAETHANFFKEKLAAFSVMFREEKDNRALDELKKINHDFDAFYEMGRRMAGAFKEGGHVEGEKMKESFALSVATISRSIELFVDSQIKRLETNMKGIESMLDKSQTVSLMIGIVILLTVIGIIYAVTGGIHKNVEKILESVAFMAKGEFSLPIEINSRDEFGLIAAGFNEMKAQVSNVIKEIGKSAALLSSSSSELSDISRQMSSNAEQTSKRSGTIATAAEQMSANISSVAFSTEHASANTGVVATSAEQMTATINEIAKNSEKARLIASRAVSDAADASGKVNELGRAAQEIGNVTETISKISEQTNLLALNATIEAARAGEAGKGFAVVANEIKQLANQTAGATGEIKREIDGIQSSTEETIREIEDISKVINEFNEIVSTIAAAIEEQSVTTKEIASNVIQASEGIQEVTQNVTQSSNVAQEIAGDISELNRASNEMAESSSQVNHSAMELDKLAGQLKEILERFKV